MVQGSILKTPIEDFVIFDSKMGPRREMLDRGALAVSTVGPDFSQPARAVVTLRWILSSVAH